LITSPNIVTEVGRAYGRHGEKRVVGWESLRKNLEEIWVDGRKISN